MNDCDTWNNRNKDSTVEDFYGRYHWFQPKLILMMLLKKQGFQPVRRKGYYYSMHPMIFVVQIVITANASFEVFS